MAECCNVTDFVYFCNLHEMAMMWRLATPAFYHEVIAVTLTEWLVYISERSAAWLMSFIMLSSLFTPSGLLSYQMGLLVPSFCSLDTGIKLLTQGLVWKNIASWLYTSHSLSMFHYILAYFSTLVTSLEPPLHREPLLKCFVRMHLLRN